MTEEKKFDFDYEHKILDFWNEKKIYDKVQEKNKGNELFNSVEGPPYPTGEIHLGHLRIWAVKDSVLRFRRLQGYEVYMRDGYDVHGLPVESKVQKKLGFKHTQDLKEFGEENFVAECKKYVAEIIDAMTQRRERYGFWLDKDFYQTSHPDYLSLAWRFFKEAHKKGLLYKDYKTVAWSPALETTLSDYEIKDEYTTLVDPSIYVKFEVKSEDRITEYKESLVIWTTTPWTIQSNMAVAVHPDFDYSYVLVELNGEKEVLILADSMYEGCLDTFSKQNDVKFLEVLKIVKGAELEGVHYNHVYLDKTPSQEEFVKTGNRHVHSVILADFVTLGEGEDLLDKLEKKGNYKHSNSAEESEEEVVEEKADVEKKKEEGTGLVHIAPGHGPEDFEVGKKYGLPIFSPVDTKGIMTEGFGKGLFFKDADKPIMEDMKSRGVLLFGGEKSHRYPLCWRSKVPVVFRATEQWYIKRSALIEGIIKENTDKVNWIPEFAKSVFNSSMENAGDWAISRQRFWGTPLPIFEDEEGNFEVFGSKEELEERVGHKLDDIHRDDLKKLEITLDNGNVAKAVPYITDVWFDSGCVSFASHYGEGLSYDEIIEKYYPMRYITEGRDQIRGWFSSLFNVGYLMTGKAPYKEVQFQQFVMAKDGSKMSKSLGNGVEGVEALNTWGADRTRFYLLSKSAPEAQINFDRDEMSNVEGFFNTLTNVSKFMNSYLKENLDESFELNLQNLDVEDLWILGRYNETVRDFNRLFEECKLNLGIKLVEDFITKDLSRVYLKLIKDRTEDFDSNLVYVFDTVLRGCLIMLAPVIPFKVESLYQELDFRDKLESLFLESMPKADEIIIKDLKSKGVDTNFELAQDIVQAILNARERVKIGVRWPLSEINIISSQNLSGALEPFTRLIEKLTNIKKISYSMDDIDVSYNVKPNFAVLKSDFDNPKEAIGTIMSNKEQISSDLSVGEVAGSYNGVELDLEKHIIKEVVLSDDLTSSEFGLGNVILHTEQDDVLIKEGFLREILRRIQDTRKLHNYNKKDKVNLSFEGSDLDLIEIIENNDEFVKAKVGAEEIFEKSLELSETYDIKGKKLVVSLE